jgi:hypothetical protein
LLIAHIETNVHITGRIQQPVKERKIWIIAGFLGIGKTDPTILNNNSAIMFMEHSQESTIMVKA